MDTKPILYSEEIELILRALAYYLAAQTDPIMMSKLFALALRVERVNQREA